MIARGSAARSDETVADRARSGAAREHSGHRMKRIGLLDQYTGANLGDAAILEAAIQNVRERFPGAEICLFALYPEESQRRHGVTSYPITGFRLSWYSDFLRSEDAPAPLASPRPTTSGAMASGRRVAQRFPLLRPVLKRLQAALAWPRKAATNLRAEVRHVRQMHALLKSFDLLVISGGGQIDDDYGGPWGHPYTLFKFACLSRLTGTKLVYWSVGVCALKSRLSDFFVRHALKPALYRSYRDPGSKQLLERNAFTKNDPVVPDIAFSYSPALTRVRVGAGDHVTVGVSPIGYLSKDWPKVDQQKFEAYRRELIAFVGGLATQGFSVVLFTSDDMDCPVTDFVYEALAADPRPQIRRNVTKADTTTLDRLVACLDTLDYVVASRLHGILLSHVCGKAVLAISYDRKVDAHMALVHQSGHSVDIHQPEAALWLSAFAAVTQNRHAIETQIRQRCAEFRLTLTQQYEQSVGA
jgi:polysaccharide pyruvyl transferase WcaK-like protein